MYVGKPIEDINVKIIKPSDEPIEDFESTWLSTGEIGEICVEGKHVLKEYYNSDEAQKFAKINYQGQVWHRTGDAGYLDNDGRLFLMGRVKNRFVHNNKDVYVFPIENALLEIEGIEIGTILKIDEQIILVAETKIPQKKLERELKNFGFNFDKFIITKIPRDPRHNSKIDYDKLRKILS